MSAAQADWDDKMRGKAKPAEPMDAAERAICSLCKGAETVWCKVAMEAATYREMSCPACQMPDYRDVVAGIEIREQAARQDERRKVVEEAAQIVDQHPCKACAEAIRALAEEVT